MKETASPEITRITLQVLCLGLLLGGAFWILQLFIPSILWATILVVTTWPLFLAVQKRLWNRRVLAILVMIGAIVVIVVVPCVVAIGSIIANTDQITGWMSSLRTMEMPSPPGFLPQVPLVGPELVKAWQRVDEMTANGLSTTMAPYLGALISWFVFKAGSLGIILVQFVFTLIIAIVLYANGESVSGTVQGFCLRLAGLRGEEVATLAARAIRSVALGVIVTALAQAVISGVGLALCGTPSAALLTAIIFVLCLCQIGPAPILIPAVIWFYWRGGMVSGSVLLFVTLIVLTLDNFLRPILIRKGADMPLLLVFIGVIGGLVAMGVIGLFIGPVILAVVYTLLNSWIKGDPAARPERPKPEA